MDPQSGRTIASSGLGIDAGGTLTRWAWLSADGTLGAQGEAPAFSALQMNDEAGRAHIDVALRSVAAGVFDAMSTALAPAPGVPPVGALCAGITGFDVEGDAALRALMAQALGIPPDRIELASDIEMSCRCAFAPGAGLVVYAGTGSIAGHVDVQGRFQRAGGRGVLLDDAGGGHWIALQALRQVWRAEDEAPGAWQDNAMARRLFDQIGGSDWADTRRAVYAASRGEVGRLALAVGAAAGDGDVAALDLLHRAGHELARLARALLRRHPVHVVRLSGRVFDLGQSVEHGLREALADLPLDLDRARQAPEVAAAARALRSRA